jgi:hypothetical protein
VTARTMTEPEAWREIARRIVEGEWSNSWMFTLVCALYFRGATTEATKKVMELRVASHLRLSAVPIDSSPESRALAALWLALEAEEEGA